MDRHKKGFHFPTAIKWEYASKFQKTMLVQKTMTRKIRILDFLLFN